MDSQTLAQTYVQHKGRWFFVSTINRRSSAMTETELWYAETLVWEWNPETRKRGRMVGQCEGARNSIVTHQEVMGQLYHYGKLVDQQPRPRANRGEKLW
jgi:hypothetical protein